jgi:hypothetical protein
LTYVDRDIAFGLLEEVGTAGNLTTDAQLAAYAIEHSAVMHSNDSDFGRFAKVSWASPLVGPADERSPGPAHRRR